MKKSLSIALVLLILLSALAIPASAAETGLPFALVAPANVTAVWLEGGDSPTTVQIAYSLSNEMTSFFKQLDEATLKGTGDQFMAKYDYDEIWVTTQVDWAVDDVNDSVSGWHCNEYWNGDYGFGYDKDYQLRVGEWDGVDMWVGNATETINEHWVTRGVSEYALNGDPQAKVPGLKDQMRPNQYEYKYVDGDGSLHIDYAQHTVYYRMRFVVTTRKNYRSRRPGQVLLFPLVKYRFGGQERAEI